jgi:protein SCO1/2
MFGATAHLSFGNSVAISIYPKPLNIAPFELETQSGTIFTEENLKSHWSLIFLGYTSCPDICPNTLLQLNALRAELEKRLSPEKYPGIIFVAVDPDRDRTVLGEYLKAFNANITGLSGEVSQLDSLVKSLGGYYRLNKTVGQQGPYEVVHSASISITNPAGHIVARITQPFEAAIASRELVQLLNQK